MLYFRLTRLVFIMTESPGDPVTNCPQYVYEGQSVSCDCLVNRSSPGFPRATAQWKDKTPGQPLVVDVTRNDSGRVFTCSLTWGPANDSITNETHYKLDVAYPPPFPPVLSVYNDRSGMTDGNPFTLICTVTGGRPLVTSVNVSCRPDVQGDVSWMNVTNTSVSVTFTILSIEARHDGTECVCTADWEVHRETYNVSASIQLRVMDTFVFPVSIVAGVAGGSVVVIILVVVVVVQVRRRRPVTKPPESDEAALEDDASTYDDDLERPGMPKDIEEDGCGYATVTEATSHGASSSDYGYAVPDMSVYTQPSGTSDRGRKASTVTEATSHRASSSDYGYAVPDMSVYTQPSGTSDRDRKASTVTVEKGGNLYAEPDVPLFTQLSRASDRNRKASTVTVEKGGNLYAEPDVPLSTQPSGAPVKDSRTPTVTLREDGSLYSVTDIVSRVTVSIPSSALETPDDPATHTYAQVDRNAKRSKSTALVFNADQSASSTDVYAQVNKATKRNTTAATEVNKGVGAHEQQPEEIVKPKPTLKPRISVKPKLNK
ncbi:uncharacterized protein [Littorina saxatilis]|uniref:uncharacterized protein isoform X1 n=1 Tax=Littorina saxatilis TaxID=31220 RepID=UPI0038B65EAE